MDLMVIRRRKFPDLNFITNSIIIIDNRILMTIVIGASLVFFISLAYIVLKDSVFAGTA